MKLQPRAWLSAGIALALGIGLVALAAPRTSAQSDRSERGFLGVSLQDLDADLRESYGYEGSGALVTNVVPDSPADKLGVRDGDILTRLDDRRVSDSDQATEYVRARKPGTLVDVWVWRGSSERNLGRAELADYDDRQWRHTPRVAPPAPRTPRAPRAPRPPRVVVPRMDLDDLPRAFALGGRGRLGVQTQDLDRDLGGYFKRPEGGGVLVLEVMEDTPASKAGLKSGDVILSVGGKDVANTDELRDALSDRDEGAVDLRVLRNGAPQTISVTLEERRRVRSWSWSGDGDWGKDFGKHMKHYKHFGPRMRVLELDDLDDLDEIRGWDDLTDEEKKELQKDMEELRKDLRELRSKFRDYRDDERDSRDRD
jgi:serine protease Do